MNIDDLLKEREKYQRQIDDATKGISAVNVLLGLQGYQGAKTEIFPAFIPSAPAPIQATTQKPQTDSLPYSELAKEWAESVSGEVTIFDFQKWIEAKHPTVVVNKNSLNGPISRLVRDNHLMLVRQGAGRAPSVYGPSIL
jgi:hypothetical protein